LAFRRPQISDGSGELDLEPLRKVVFLLGAGASIEAGMPSVVSLTKQLRCQLPSVRDVNGKIRPGFAKLFDRISRYDPQVLTNYERFFEWTEYLLKTQKDPFRHITRIKLGRHLIDAAAHFAYIVRGEIVKLFKSRKTSHAYLSRLNDFIPARGRLEVFTLNYDCCVEDACAAKKTYLTTGFDPGNKQWKAQLFHGKQRGINLYKLHGSLRWFGTTDTKKLAKGLWTDSYFFLELKDKDRRSLTKTFEVSEEPTLVLGPAPKLQTDDPFLTLFYKFHQSSRTAKACVVVGYGYGDDHVNEKLDEAIKLGVHVLNVNLADPPTRFFSCSTFHHLKVSAKRALEHGLIKSELVRLGI
jgi:hypothetical protein